MRVTKGARLTAKLVRGLREGSIKPSIIAHAPDRTDGFHSLYERDRPKLPYTPLPDGRAQDNFFRITDDFTFPNDIIFYRGVAISALCHIDHMLDDVCYRLAQLEPYRGVGSFKQRTEDKIALLRKLASLPGPLSPSRHRVFNVTRLIERYLTFRNLMAHGHFGMHLNRAQVRVVGIRKFGQPTKSGMEFRDIGTEVPLSHLSRCSSRLDLLARHVDKLHFLVCNEMNLPPGLMEIGQN